MFLEHVFPPIPSEPMVPLAGFTTTQGTLPFVGVVIAGLIGSVMGAVAELRGQQVGGRGMGEAVGRHARYMAHELERGDLAGEGRR